MPLGALVASAQTMPAPADLTYLFTINAKAGKIPAPDPYITGGLLYGESVVNQL